jgi:hypothetical protein
VILKALPMIFFGESSFGLKLNFYPKFELPMCPGTGLKCCVVMGFETYLVLRFGPNLALDWAKPNN